MKKTFRIPLIILLFLLALTIVRLFWGDMYKSEHHPIADNGVLDLRQGQLEDRLTIPLLGKWKFYPDVLLDKALLKTPDNGAYSTFPNGWNKIPHHSDYTVGTYHLKILLPKSSATVDYGIRMPIIQSASKLFIDGVEIGGSGNPSTKLSEYAPLKVPYTVSFRSEKDAVDMTIQVAHGKYPIRSSEVGVVKFGYAEAINKETAFSVISQIVVLAVLGVVAIFTAFLYFFGKRPKSLLYFFLLLIAAMFMILLDVDKFLLKLMPIPYEISVKLLFLVYTSIASFMLLFFKHLLPEFANKTLLNWFLAACMVYVGFIILAPVSYILKASFLLGIVLLTTTCFITVQFYKATKNQLEDVLYLLLSAAAITNNVIWAIIYSNTTIERFFYPVDLLITIFLFSAFWLKRFFRNVHRIERLSEELLEADKRKDAFLANTSHELRNPLHSMINIGHSLLHNKENKLNVQDRQDLALLVTVGKRMSSMINDLLDLGKIKEKKLSLKLKPVHLQAITAGVVDMLLYLVEDRPVRIKNNISRDARIVIADENRLIQILINLLHNSIKYTEKGTITISAEYLENKAVISVSDTGIGMRKDRIHSIFQPYEQGVEDNIDVRGGVGLGLTITNQLVKLHGGEMKVLSEVHKGSVFSFSLPLAKENVVQVEKSSASPTGRDEAAVTKSLEKRRAILHSETPKILIVDDETINLRVLKSLLASEQYEITTVLNGADALEKLQMDKFHLLITDVMMPYMSGYELTKKVRQQYTLSELPILLLVARNSPEDLYTGFSSGANDYIAKPIDPMELRSRVDVLVKLKTSITEHMRMEAAWLQAQIKPHFLFNTLNSILYLMEVDEVKMRYVLDHFIQFIQTSFAFKNTDSLVGLKEELTMVHSYIEIEKARFGDRVKVEWAVDQSINVKLPPLSIQTLVENAINHGILKKAIGGKIIVQVKKQDDGLTRISISDNGVGMHPEQQAHLANYQPTERTGVGIFNTDRRLRQLFGKGLDIKSELNVGTTISFTIPTG
ncbi:hybrid sensor histidine kinase/response regulator [Oceanobacillus manasiensis]|uniref:hybrid sensor histidine kinase/response regulator n=1 Tax=Oceanobacillus manasiensis TaxID=586413 RepID=UPI0005AAA1B8|nr:ATP-binding protein [Oceanobacillus manasiensis]